MLQIAIVPFQGAKGLGDRLREVCEQYHWTVVSTEMYQLTVLQYSNKYKLEALYRSLLKRRREPSILPGATAYDGVNVYTV